MLSAGKRQQWYSEKALETNSRGKSKKHPFINRACCLENGTTMHQRFVSNERMSREAKENTTFPLSLWLSTPFWCMPNKGWGVLRLERKTHLKRDGVKVMAERAAWKLHFSQSAARQLTQFKGAFGQLLKSKAAATKAEKGSKNAFLHSKRESFLKMRERGNWVFCSCSRLWSGAPSKFEIGNLAGSGVAPVAYYANWQALCCLNARTTTTTTQHKNKHLSVLREWERMEISFASSTCAVKILLLVVQFFDKKNTPRQRDREKSSSLDRSTLTHNNTNIAF